MEEATLKYGSISEICKLFADGKVQVSDAAAWYANRIETLDKTGEPINAVREVSTAVGSRAGELDESVARGNTAGPLHGITVLVKDNILTADGMTASSGSAAFNGYVPKREATIITKLEAAGAVILGKTNMTEFADYLSDNMPSGYSSAGGVVRNPLGYEYGRGLGSSVGSAAAVAAGFAPVALGSETQNSLQTPAVVSSVFAFKPSIGLTSRAGVAPLVTSQDSPGVLARSFDDLVAITRVIQGADCRDTMSLISAHSGIGEIHPLPASQLKVGILRRPFADSPELQDAMAAFQGVIDKLAAHGVNVVDPCDLPSAEQLQEIASSVFRTEFKVALTEFLAENGNPCGIANPGELIKWYDENPEAMPYGKTLLEAAWKTNGLADPTYLADRRRDIVLSRNAGIDAALSGSGADVLIAPMSVAAKCTGKAGAPVLAIPCGADRQGKPFGITVIASLGQDQALLEASATISGLVAERLFAPL